MKTTNFLTPEQCLGARAMLQITREKLGERSLVAVATIADFEKGRGEPHNSTKATLQAALEAAGAVFTWDETGGVGVLLATRRIKKRPRRSLKEGA